MNTHELYYSKNLSDCQEARVDLRIACHVFMGSLARYLEEFIETCKPVGALSSSDTRPLLATRSNQRRVVLIGQGGRMFPLLSFQFMCIINIIKAMLFSFMTPFFLFKSLEYLVFIAVDYAPIDSNLPLCPAYFESRETSLELGHNLKIVFLFLVHECPEICNIFYSFTESCDNFQSVTFYLHS